MAKLNDGQRDGPRDAAEEPGTQKSPDRAQHEEDRQGVAGSHVEAPW